MEHLLKFAPLGTSRRRYYDAKMRDDPSTTDFETRKEMVNKLLSEPRTLMWDDSVSVDRRMRALNIHDSSITHTSFTYQKGSEFRGIFDFHLMKMKQSGIFDRVMSRYLPDPLLAIGIAEANRLGYDNAIFPVIVLSFGSIGALLVLLVERMIRYLLPKCLTRQDALDRGLGKREGWLAEDSSPN